MRRVILDLCGGTGAWSRPWREAGYIVELITLPEYDVEYVDIENIAMEFWRQDVHWRESNTVLYSDIYGILAAPPCTEFSLAKNGSGKPRNLAQGMETVQACMKIIWACFKYGNPTFWALENPVGLLRKFLGKPAYTFRQWQYGEFNLKPTDLWGRFKCPVPMVMKEPVDTLFQTMRKRYKGGKTPGKGNTFAFDFPPVPGWYNGPKLDRAARRAITPDGFAEAFFRANAKVVL